MRRQSSVTIQHAGSMNWLTTARFAAGHATECVTVRTMNERQWSMLALIRMADRTDVQTDYCHELLNNLADMIEDNPNKGNDMESKPATDKEWIDAATDGATVTAHPDTIAMITKDDPQLAERIVPDERIEVGKLVAVRKCKPIPAVTMHEWRLRVRADALERLVQAWKKADLYKMMERDHYHMAFDFSDIEDAKEFRKCMAECESLFLCETRVNNPQD